MTDPTRADPDVGAIRRAALAATPGPWSGGHRCDGLVRAGEKGYRFGLAEVFAQVDAAYIATMDPPTTLALLDRLEAAEARADAAEKRAAELGEGLRLFADDADAWTDDAADRYLPRYCEPSNIHAHPGSRAKFSVGDLRAAARLLDPAHTAETGGDRG